MNEHAARRSFEIALSKQRPAFEEFFLARFLDLKFEYRDAQCVVTFELEDFMFNPQGSLHGGIIAMVMDISMGHLLNHAQGPGLTLEMKIQYIKAARTGSLRCVGEFIRLGRGVSYLKSTLRDAEGDVVAFATSTWKRLNI
ncbi:PaaI family thioesterase [Achromobacter aloeverae]|uniref:Thioesterase n=1 Tax=Achromobacter aloeverae TaxID=1750518 RepID=A0A4Q1HMV2_9BURK|nr:PaaI family thioesterase [Achromobacter aloeverae]RXN91272.1 thioesterase [Achromobacter aloeverae]